jgi:DNA-binding winged helix-turn-helix (wHTH) protein
VIVALRFGEFVLDEEQRQLLCHGAPVHVEPKAFDLLTLLVRHRPKALPKQAIHDAVWPATHVSESSLAGLVLDLRVALRDELAHPRFIRTVRGYGYAFCGSAVDDTVPPASAFLRWAVVCGDREIPLPDGVHLVGRSQDCLVRIESVRVSRRHAQLVVSGERVAVEDLGSRNGTWVAGSRIQGRIALDSGAEVRIGDVAVRLLAVGPDAPTLSGDENRGPT